MYDGAANIIYWHSCCVEISISVYHYHFPVSVVDEDAKRTFPCERLARHIRPEFRRTLLKRSGSPKNMFEGELSSDPFPRRGRFGFGPMKSLKDQRETSERRRQTVSLSVVGAELIFR